MGFLYHLAPTLHLILDESAEFVRRGRPAIDVELLEALLDLACADRFVDRAVEGPYNVRRRAVRDEHAVPFVGLEAGQRVRGRWNVRQAFQPALARVRDGLQLAALDQADA